MKNAVINDRGNVALAACLGALRVLKHKSDPFKAWVEAQAHTIGDILEGAGHDECPALANYLANPANVALCRDDLARWASRGINAVGYTDNHYPELLRLISNPPPILFYRGSDASNLNSTPQISIVGSRNCDKSGAEIAFGLSKDLVAAGACVVSGLALGIDAMAHRGALASKSEFPTIAILGNGLDSIYPTSHERLANQLLDAGGLLVSQFEPDEKPYPSNFLNRNRLIAGISLGVLVVQASKRSGSLVTARYALEEGREVMSIPGSIFDQRHEGTNKIIKDGAYLVRSAADIWEILPTLKRVDIGAREKAIELDPNQRIVFELIKSGEPVHHDLLAQKSGLGEALPAAILALELADLLERQPGNLIGLKRIVGQ
jgi:DNA processing protein